MTKNRDPDRNDWNMLAQALSITASFAAITVAAIQVVGAVLT